MPARSGILLGDRITYINSNSFLYIFRERNFYCIDRRLSISADGITINGVIDKIIEGMRLARDSDNQVKSMGVAVV